jgi:GT2 family glycosyltransferase
MTPFVSVIIPTYNRLGHLIHCLRAIEGVDFPRERFEVIVVDDGGSVPVRSAIDELSLAVDMTLVRQDNAGPGAARASGAQRARGQYLIFLDDDCYPERAWLGALAARLETGRLEAVAGKTLNGCPGNLYDCASHLLSYSLYEQYTNGAASVEFLATNNLAVPAGLFRAIGGFHPDLRLAYEDREFCDRWLSFGYGLTYAPEAVVRHCRSMTMRSFCRQHWIYGRMASRYYTLKSNRALSRIRGHLPRLYFDIVRRAVRRQPTILALLALSQVIAAAGFLREQFRLVAGKSGMLPLQ